MTSQLQESPVIGFLSSGSDLGCFRPMLICKLLACFLVLFVCYHVYFGTQIRHHKILPSSTRDFTEFSVGDNTGMTASRTRDQCPKQYLPNSALYDLHAGDLDQRSPYNDKGQSSRPVDYKDRVLILTPVSDSRNFLDGYFRLLCSLNYPHHLISVAIGEDSSTDDTFEYAQFLAGKMQRFFRSIKVFHFKGNFKNVPHEKRHGEEWQEVRRSHLARSRNNLLFRALRNEKWVLWIDVDVKYFSPDIIQHLLSAQRPVVAPNCLYRPIINGTYLIYDRNTWRETEDSLQQVENEPEDFLQLEGYSKTNRLFLRDIQDEGLVVPIDGVGGCALLVEAESHRRGLIFPPFVFDHHIETEGLAKMAAKMSIPVYGLPFVNVVHA